MQTFSIWILPGLILVILTLGIFKKVPLYETFVDGAKDGFHVAITIIPYLVAIMVAIAMFRASGAIDFMAKILAPVLNMFKVPADVIPIAVVAPLSGSAKLGIFSEIAHNGANLYATRLGAVMVGSSETTLYVLAVYFGAVGISKMRYALLAGLLADLVGIIAAITVCRLIFL